MKIFIIGASGFVGSNLVNYLKNKSFDVEAISRADLNESAEILSLKIDGTYAIINLAGATISKRWTRKHKREIYKSRIFTTKKIVEAIGLCKNRPEILINASAIGIYDDTHVHDEQSGFLANNYLSKVIRDWEHAANNAMEFGTKVFIFRLGIVLGKNGGALKKLFSLFKLGLGGKIGNGKQYFSFIHINDIMNIVDLTLNKKLQSGLYNLTSPEIITNSEFTKQLAGLLKKPAIFNIPKSIMFLMYGEGGSVFIGGQAANPAKLLEQGYKFLFPTLNEGLKNELN